MGRVEVYVDGQWGTICGHDFDDQDATVNIHILSNSSYFLRTGYYVVLIYYYFISYLGCLSPTWFTIQQWAGNA